MSDSASKSLKIIMAVANNTYPADPRVLNEARTLVDAGHQVTVIAPKSKNQIPREVIDKVQVVRYPPPPEGGGALGYAIEFFYVTLATAFILIKEWLSQGFDVFHIHNPPDTLFLAGLLPKLFGKRLVYDHHDLAPELYLTKFDREGGLVYRALLLLERWTCQMADHVIVVNQSYKQSDMQRNGVKAEDITIVRNAPPVSSLKPVEPDCELGNRASVVVGYLGHIARQDGVDHLIQALHHVQTDFGYDDWYAVIIGPGDELDTLKQLAVDLGIREKIWFTGYQPHAAWRKLLASVDVCVVPDPANLLNEKSTMIKMMDYMALGKPIVAYDMTENRVSGGDAALYAEASDAYDLARQLMRLIDDPALRHQLSTCGQRRIKEQLAWEYSARNLINFYKSAIFQSKTNNHKKRAMKTDETTGVSRWS